MDLKRLRYFCRVVEHGSVSQAAKSLNMAQPPLSKRIQELEEELQVSLFERRGNRIEPTEAGISYIEKAVKFTPGGGYRSGDGRYCAKDPRGSTYWLNSSVPELFSAFINGALSAQS